MWHQIVEIFCRIAISALILQSEWIWLILFVWLDFMFREEAPHFPISWSPQLQQLIGDSDWQISRSRIWGLLFAFQQGKESSTPFYCLYSHWYCIPAKPRELQSVTHPPGTPRLCGLRRRIAFVSAPLLCPASPSGGERARLALQLSRLNHIKPFLTNQTKIALYWPHRVIC